jgi:hypothetical protein
MKINEPRWLTVLIGVISLCVLFHILDVLIHTGVIQ